MTERRPPTRKPSPVQNERAGHTLQHGAIWVTYRPDLPADQLDLLRALAGREKRVLVSPYPGLPAAVVASAWARQLRLDSADDARLEQFVQAFEDGEQAPTAGEPC